MNGAVVCNTGPLIAFSMINGLDILHSLFEEIIVPEAVHQEILQGGSCNIGLANYLKDKRIKVIPPNRPLDPLLKTFLDAGEASVIRLAIQLNTDFVLIDERRARKVARTIYNLNVIGSVRVLVEAKRRKLLNNIAEALKNMRERGYWIHDDIVNAALKEVGEM